MDNGTRLIEWTILIATISGFIIQPILTHFLENKRDKRLKKLEKNEKLFSKTLDELGKSLENIKEFNEDLEE